MNFPAWQIWCAAALILMIGEVLTPGFLLACFSVSALASAAAAWFGLSGTCQFTAFAIAGLILMFTLRPFMLKYLSRPELRSNADALVGSTGIVLTDIGFDGGYIDLQGARWLARSADGTPIPKGTKVTVLSVGGASVTVRPLSSEK